MVNYRHLTVIIVLLLNSFSLLFIITVNSSPLLRADNLSMLKGDPLLFERSIPPPIDSMSVKEEMAINSAMNPLVIREYEPRFSVQQQSHILLNETFDEPNVSFVPKNRIWADLLGTDSYSSSMYENALIDPHNNAGEEDGASLFTRIGNTGTDKSTAVVDLSKYLVSNISAGWQLDFPVQDSYSMISISFKWRFDALEDGFDYLDIFDINGTIIIMDDTPDYQEIRCRIEHPTEPTSSFWIGNQVNDTNPNGTVFYRVGANITQDEVWYTFQHSFQVDPESSNFTLELGAYLNTREYWNEYFDVWFDDILILGINDIPDTNPPQPIATGLDRTSNITLFDFWANFSEGTWETPIKNVTVFYNQSGAEYNRTFISNLNQTPWYLNNAGYNQTRWQFLTSFNFSDNITYYFVVYDYANNSFVSEFQSQTIGDYTAPEIISTVIDQTGTGIIIISVNVTDWGNGIGLLVLNYTIDGEPQDPLSISGIGTDYQANFTLDMSQFYGSVVEFGISLNDTASPVNSVFYSGADIISGYPIMAVTDEILPEIQEVTIEANKTVEERTHVTVNASDPFGEIDEVYLVISYENGTIHEDYSHVTLKITNTSGEYGLGKIAGVEALQLPFSNTYENYSIEVFVRDKAAPFNEVNETYYHVVEDEIAPVVFSESIELEYTQPGSLRVWVRVNDFGSGIGKVFLEKKSKDEWKQYNMSEDENGMYTTNIPTGLLGNERIELRIYAVDNEGNEIPAAKRPTEIYSTKIFFVTFPGLLIIEILVVISFISVFTGIKMTQMQQLKALRERRFEIALGRSERLAYLGEEAIFGFIAAYSQKEGVSSVLMWEPRLIGHFYQYLKELTDKANNTIAFIMQTKPQDHVTFVDFNIEKIGCNAITFAYPVSTLPQQWLSTLTLDQVPLEGGQGTLLIMLIMREKWGEIANNFQEEIADGVVELKDLITSGEDKQTILEKAREFRLFISGTLEVLDEIETETDEISDDIMGDFETEFLDTPEEDSLQEESDEQDSSEPSSDENHDI